MIRADAVARIQRKLGFRSDLETEIIDALKDAQLKLEREAELPWFLRSEVATANTTINEERVPLPADFIRECDDDDTEGLYYFNSDADMDEQWVPLEKITLAELREAYQSSTGAPEVFVLDDEYFRIGPTPDAVYPLKMIYYAKDTVLDTNIENKWLAKAEDLIIGMAGLDIAESARDQAAQGFFSQMMLQGRKRLDDENTARREAGRSRQMGGKD